MTRPFVIFAAVLVAALPSCIRTIPGLSDAGAGGEPLSLATRPFPPFPRFDAGAPSFLLTLDRGGSFMDAGETSIRARFSMNHVPTALETMAASAANACAIFGDPTIDTSTGVFAGAMTMNDGTGEKPVIFDAGVYALSNVGPLSGQTLTIQYAGNTDAGIAAGSFETALNQSAEIVEPTMGALIARNSAVRVRWQGAVAAIALVGLMPTVFGMGALPVTCAAPMGFYDVLLSVSLWGTQSPGQYALLVAPIFSTSVTIPGFDSRVMEWRVTAIPVTVY